MHSSLYCPFEAPLHDEVERLELETRAWARGHGLLSLRADETYGRSRFAWLVARTFGYARFEDLRLANDFCVWLFVRDDQIDDASQAACRTNVLDGRGQHRALVEGVSASGAPLEQAIADIGLRIRARGGRGWLGRFAHHFGEYLEATRWERLNDGQERPPAVPSYRELRRAAGAVQPCLDLGAIFWGVRVDAPWLTHPCVRALEALANDHITWTNDLFGFDRERAEGNQNNIVSAFVRADELDVADAKGRTVAACNAVVEAFFELEATLPSLGIASTETDGYRRAMKRWMRGNLDWYADTGRYQSGTYRRPSASLVDTPVEVSG